MNWNILVISGKDNKYVYSLSSGERIESSLNHINGVVGKINNRFIIYKKIKNQNETAESCTKDGDSPVVKGFWSFLKFYPE